MGRTRYPAANTPNVLMSAATGSSAGKNCVLMNGAK